MSSPVLNNIILVGCMLAYISMILMGINSSLLPQTAFIDMIMNVVCAVKLIVKLDSSLVLFFYTDSSMVSMH